MRRWKKLIYVDICNTIADVNAEIEKILGPRPVPEEYFHPLATDGFFLKHPEVFIDAAPFPGAAQSLHRLIKDLNSDIVYISARPEWAKKITISWLKENGFPDGDLILSADKAAVAKDLYVSMAIEDAPFEIEKLKAAGIQVIVKSQPYNKKYGPQFLWPGEKQRSGRFFCSYEVK